MRIQSIGTKLTIWYAILLAVTFLVLGSFTYGLLAYSLSKDMDLALNGVADVMAQKARAEGESFYPVDIDELFQRFFGFSRFDQHIEILNPNGEPEQQPVRSPLHNLPLTPKALESVLQGIPFFETITFTNSYPMRVLTMPVVDAGQVANLVRVGMSLENMYKTRHRFLLIMALVFPLGLFLSVGGGWLLARRALSPVDKMTQIVKRISGERLHQRLQESGNGDELDRLAKTLNDMLGRLDNAIHQMRQFSADASHELQTPLTILRGEMEVALRLQRSPEEYQRVLTSGLEEIARINHLVEGLLLLARADAGVLCLDLETVELKALSLEICAQMKAVAVTHAIDLQVNLPEPVAVLGDREHLRRLILNLMDNAIKYTSDMGRVTISLCSDNKWVSLSISDTGIGFSQNAQGQIFSRFYRATEARSRDGKGVGLGLSIANSIVEVHGGRIEVESLLCKGSTFTVHLPVHPT